MKKFIKLLSILFICIFTLVLTACTLDFSDDPSTPTVKRITVKDPYVDCVVGESFYLKFSMNFELEPNDYLSYESTDTTVCKVLSTGYVLALGKGECKITVSYEDAKATFFIYVTQESTFTQPVKKEYYLGEELDLTGGKIEYLDQYGNVSSTVNLTNDMASGYDNSKTGEQTITINDSGTTYEYVINVKELENAAYLVSSINPLGNLKQNELLEFKTVHSDYSKLKNKLASFYDYDEYSLVLSITTPSHEVDKVYGFYYQDYTENHTNCTMNPSECNEGKVNSATGYNYKTTFTAKGDPYYSFRYLPKETGTYDYVLEVMVGSKKIQTLNGEFSIASGKQTKGNIKVSANKKTFEFENGDTYTAVGQNVGWYTSKQRRYNDYRLWFSQMAENNCTFARVWLSGWGFSLFWGNVKNYNNRLDEAYELDQVIKMAEEYGIYLDLSLFQHGMFSETVNPMWPNSNNTWYTTKYGANPYSKIIDSPGKFFTDNEAKRWCKNYLTYISARYGYSEAIMSYELFNEVDWVESYTATIGTKWHEEMANVIKNANYSNHMVTTSVKGDDFSKDVYSVFNLDVIDYVNVHNYGTKNYLNYIPGKVLSAYTKFNKPIMYQEVGYNGNGGSDQISSDPNDVTLHQELWAGLMSSGSTGMNWWWDSWIEVSKSYGTFKAPGIVSSLMDLSGDMSLLYKSSNVTNSNTDVTTLGYLFNNRAYVYLFNKNYSVSNQSVTTKTNFTLSGLTNGTYKVEFMDTISGNITSTKEVNVTSGKISFTSLSSLSFTNDLMIIINKK